MIDESDDVAVNLRMTLNQLMMKRIVEKMIANAAIVAGENEKRSIPRLSARSIVLIVEPRRAKRNVAETNPNLTAAMGILPR